MRLYAYPCRVCGTVYQSRSKPPNRRFCPEHAAKFQYFVNKAQADPVVRARLKQVIHDSLPEAYR